MKQPPAFQFYASDFLADGKVREMTYEALGVYVTLLSIAWNERGLPLEPERIRCLLKVDAETFSRVWPSVSRCWKPRRGRLINPRQEQVRRTQADYRRKKAAAAYAMHERRKARAALLHDADAMHKGSLQSPSPVSDLQSPSPHPQDAERAPRANGSGSPSPDRERVTTRAGKGPPLDEELRALVLATVHLQPLADVKHARFWQALERELEPYDWLVLDDELRAADAWIAANPARAPTVGGLARFFRAWCRRTVDGQRSAHGETTTRPR